MMAIGNILLAAALAGGEEPAKAAPDVKANANAEATTLAHALTFLGRDAVAANACSACHTGVIAKCPGNQHAHKGIAAIWAGHAADQELFAVDLSPSTYAAGTQWRLTPASPALRAQLKLPAQVGLVPVVPVGSPAAKAGLDGFDVLVALDGKPLGKPEDWDAAVQAAKTPNVPCQLYRAGKETKLDVAVELFRPAKSADVVARQFLLTDAEERFVGRYVGDEPVQPQPARVGVHLTSVDDALRAQLPQLAKGQGMMINSVEAGMPAETAGLKAHDIVTKLDGKEVGAEEEFRKVVQANDGKEIAVEYLRGGKTRAAKVTPQRPDQQRRFTSVIRFNPAVVKDYRSLAGTLRLDTTVPTAAAVGDARAEMRAAMEDLDRLQARLKALDAKLAAEAKPAPAAKK